jgi:hypothetical protein
MYRRWFLSSLIGVMLCAALVDAQSSSQGALTIAGANGDRPIARVADGKWIADAKCVPPAGDLSVTGDVRQTPLRAVKPGSPEWLRLAPMIMDLFERREREQRLSDRTSDAPRAVDWIYTAESDGSLTHYFEASRRVASASPDVDHDTDPPGTVRIAVAGFLHDARGRLTALDTKSELRWEQDGLPAGPSRPDLTPLGVVSYRGRSIWVMRGQSGTSGWLTLYDVSADGTRTVLTARAPVC